MILQQTPCAQGCNWHNASAVVRCQSSWNIVNPSFCQPKGLAIGANKLSESMLEFPCWLVLYTLPNIMLFLTSYYSTVLPCISPHQLCVSQWIKGFKFTGRAVDLQYWWWADRILCPELKWQQVATQTLSHDIPLYKSRRCLFWHATPCWKRLFFWRCSASPESTYNEAHRFRRQEARAMKERCTVTYLYVVVDEQDGRNYIIPHMWQNHHERLE